MMRMKGNIDFDQFGQPIFVGYEDFGTTMVQKKTKPDLSIGPGGGQQKNPNVPQMEADIMLRRVANWGASIRSLTPADNEIPGAAGLLVANTASVESIIFTKEVPRNVIWHFRPQFVKYRDSNICSYLLLLQNAVPGYLAGSYRVVVYNTDMNRIRGVIASGSLTKFAIPGSTTAEASLVDINKRVYYSVDLWAQEGDKIYVYITSPTALVPATSDMAMEFVQYTP
jgi:hypothetical protein